MKVKRYEIEIQSFGKRFKQLRRQAGLTQLDIEVRSGIAREVVSRIENGLKNVEFSTIVTLAEALDLPLQELFIFSDKK